MFVLGTAGHVDHGKSSFLRRLTGIEPDRLPEEKKRGMTIDLNFAWIDSPAHGRVGIVDVPGHRRFVKNMISGVTHVDAFLFLVAADDGWMPQSEEHAAVLKSFGVNDGVALVTKIDLVDSSRATEVAQEVGRRLPGIEVLPFSSETGTGLVEVRAAIERLLARLPAPRRDGAPRLWIDRVFHPKGMGVVATGTLREGCLREGDEVTVGDSRGVIKSLQSYGRPIKVAEPTARIAIGFSKIKVERGMLVTAGEPFTTRRFDAKLDAFTRLGRRQELALHVGSLRMPALVMPIGEGFARLKTAIPLPVREGERFVLRSPGEEQTCAAGVVIDPRPAARKHPRSWSGDPIDYELVKSGLVDLNLLARASTRANLCEVIKSRDVVQIGPGLFLDRSRYDGAAKVARERCLAHHAETGEALPEGDLASAMKVPAPARVLASLVIAGKLRKEKRGYWAAGYQKISDPRENGRRAAIRKLLAVPTSLREIESGVTDAKKSVWSMVNEGAVVSLAEDHFVGLECYDAAKQRVRDYLAKRESATTSELRQFLETSRKNAVLLLEQMDRERLTYLKDGVRRLLK